MKSYYEHSINEGKNSMTYKVDKSKIDFSIFMRTDMGDIMIQLIPSKTTELDKIAAEYEDEDDLGMDLQKYLKKKMKVDVTYRPNDGAAGYNFRVDKYALFDTLIKKL